MSLFNSMLSFPFSRLRRRLGRLGKRGSNAPIQIPLTTMVNQKVPPTTLLKYLVKDLLRVGPFLFITNLYSNRVIQVTSNLRTACYSQYPVTKLGFSV